MMVIIVGRFWQVRVLAMSTMAVSIIVASMSVVLVVVVVVAVVVDSVVVKTEISLERHVVAVSVVVVAGVGSDGGLEVRIREVRPEGWVGEPTKLKVCLALRSPAQFETSSWASTNLLPQDIWAILFFIFSDRTLEK